MALREALEGLQGVQGTAGVQGRTGVQGRVGLQGRAGPVRELARRGIFADTKGRAGARAREGEVGLVRASCLV